MPNTNDQAISQPGFLPSRRQFFFLLGFYFLLQAVSRGLMSETLGLDDAEQLLVAQHWLWGYGPQPPIYTWLLMILGHGIGFSSFSMALLKNILLFGIYVLTYFNARLLTRSHAAAVVAAVALQFMPSISYEAHRELTHSILASMMVLATLFVFLNLKPDRWAGYVLLGLCAGLGSMSKYNFALFFVGLLLAGISTASWRPLVLNRRMVPALLLALVIVLPHLLWISGHHELAFASMYKFKIDDAHRPVAALAGLWSWFKEVIDQVAILVAIFLALFWRPRQGPPRKASPGETLLLRMFLWTGLVIGIGVCASGATKCHNRWLQPVLVPMPLLLVAMWHERFDRPRLKAILVLGAIVTLVVLIAAPGRILLTETLRKEEILNAPFRNLAADLKTPMAGGRAIYAEDRWLAGNLRIWFPDAAITIPEMTRLYAPDTNALIVWDATLPEDPQRAQATLRRIQRAQAALRDPNQTYAEPEYYQETLKYHHTATMRLGVLRPQ